MMAANILGLVGTPDLAAFLGNHQAEVHSEPAVGGARVRPHVSSWVHDGVFDLRRKCNTLVIVHGGVEEVLHYRDCIKLLSI